MMHEYAGKSMEEATSEIMLRTCQLLPKSYDTVSDGIYTQIPRTSLSPIMYAMSCGSSAEFYIRPLNKLINDIDTLLWNSNELAFVEDFPVLPNDVSRLDEVINCLTIESYPRYPGFIRLRLFGLIKYNWKLKTYAISHASLPNKYRTFNLENLLTGSRPTTVTGPSVSSQINAKDIKLDDVSSVWCPQWPKEAQDWSKRHRGYGWPKTVQITEVVEYGCHAVYAQHRACRDDKEQFRLSFSVAEVILLRSWTPVQQMVYHLLRFLSNKELIEKDCPKEDEVLCTYHLKTLMLWTCEEMSPEWWNSSSLVAICCELLKKLAQWLKRKHFPNYFIPEANLFYQPSNSTMLDKIEARLNKFQNSGTLGGWFYENYIQPMTVFSYRTTTGNTAWFDTLPSVIDTLQDKNSLNSFNILLEHEFMSYSIQVLNSNKWYGEDSCISYMKALRNFALFNHSTLSILPVPEDVSYFSYFDRTLFSMHARNDLDNGKTKLNDQIFVDYVKGILNKLKIVRCQNHIFPQASASAGSRFNLLQALDLMENLTGIYSPSEFQVVSLMSKEFLVRALVCNDSHSSDIASGALIYLAALHFAISAFEIVIDLCTPVLMNQSTSNECETLNAACLLFIDDIARIVGFRLLCKKLSENVCFCKRQIYLDLRLTTKVFAFHLTVKSADSIPIKLELNSLLSAPTFCLDQFLLALMKRNLGIKMKSSVCLKSPSESAYMYRKVDPLLAIETLRLNPVIATQTLIENLTEYAFENMTSFYKEIRINLGFQSSTVDCLRALHLYKKGKYDEVLHLCKRILQQPGMEYDFSEFAYANVWILPPFDSFFDNDVKSLLGFNTLFCYLSLLNMRRCDLHVTLFVPYFFTRFVFAVKAPLVGSFGIYCLHRCHYVVGRHFLARYLRVRCSIDCRLPCAEAVAEFVAMRSIFPFEKIIRWFVLRNIVNHRA